MLNLIRLVFCNHTGGGHFNTQCCKSPNGFIRKEHTITEAEDVLLDHQHCLQRSLSDAE